LREKWRSRKWRVGENKVDGDGRRRNIETRRQKRRKKLVNFSVVDGNGGPVGIILKY
jgi:hypothetical protein